jgi:ribosomal protein S27AE
MRDLCPRCGADSALYKPSDSDEYICEKCYKVHVKERDEEDNN